MKADAGFLADGETAGDGSIAFRLTSSCTESGMRYESYRARYKYKRGPSKEADTGGGIAGWHVDDRWRARHDHGVLPGQHAWRHPGNDAGNPRRRFVRLVVRPHSSPAQPKDLVRRAEGQHLQGPGKPEGCLPRHGADRDTNADPDSEHRGGSLPRCRCSTVAPHSNPTGRPSGIAPHAQASRARLQNGWTLSAGGHTVAWQPKAIDVDLMLKTIARATGDDVKVVRDGAPPLLEVVELQGPIIAGAPSALRLTVRNSGSGSAYRVIVETSSSEPSMHGARFVFGSLGPGKSATRSVAVNLPVTHKGGTAVVVLRFSEANNNVPSQASKRIKIVAGRVAALRLSCGIAKGATGSGTSWVADAGATLLVRCTLLNAGRATARNATFSASLGGTTRSTPKKHLRPKGKTSAGLLLRVPANGTTGQRYKLVVSATENSVARATTRQTLVIEIGQQRICTPPISRAEYNRKLNKLKGDRKQGLIDKATFRRFEAQLVGCLR